MFILTHDYILERFGEVTVTPVTTTVRATPSVILPGKQDGMTKDCAINFDHIQTVSKGKIGSLITRLSKEKLEQVREAIQFALDLKDHLSPISTLANKQLSLKWN